MIKIRYVLKNVFTGSKHLKIYHISQVELGGLSGLFDFENYEIISRDRYTGLKDKNGKEIYEGDRIRYSNSMEHGEGIIGFSAGFIIEWDLSTVKTEHPMIMQPLFYFQCSAEIEVIGNIHELSKEVNNG